MHCNILFQYPTELFLSIMGKSVSNILWFLKKSFSFLAVLLHNLTINFIWNCLCMHRLSRSRSVTYLVISVDVKFRGQLFSKIVFFAFHHYLATNVRLNNFVCWELYFCPICYLKWCTNIFCFNYFTSYLCFYFLCIFMLCRKEATIFHIYGKKVLHIKPSD